MIELTKKYNLEIFFNEISVTGGEINIAINLYKDKNIGDTLTKDQMYFLIKNNINISVEYFP